jgi:hypothetical protein
MARAATRPAHFLIRALSLLSYLYAATLGLKTMVAPWSSEPVPADTAARSAFAVRLFIGQYLLEATLALATGATAMRAWTASEVIRHHLAVGLTWAPAAFGNMAYQPDAWVALMTRHPPVVAAIATACCTGFNEASFVLRSFLPEAWADTPRVRYAQSWMTLLALLQNVPLTVSSCLIGMWALLLGEPRDVPVVLMHRVLLFLTYCVGPPFAVLVQVGYVRTNMRRVARGVPKSDQ